MRVDADPARVRGRSLWSSPALTDLFGRRAAEPEFPFYVSLRADTAQDGNAPRVLELGCGTGRLLREWPSSVRAEGLEIHPELVAHTRRFASVIEGDFREWQPPVAAFDLVYCPDATLGVVPRALECDWLARWIAALKPGGILAAELMIARSMPLTLAQYHWRFPVPQELEIEVSSALHIRSARGLDAETWIEHAPDEDPFGYHYHCRILGPKGDVLLHSRETTRFVDPDRLNAAIAAQPVECLSEWCAAWDRSRPPEWEGDHARAMLIIRRNDDAEPTGGSSP